MPKMPCRNQYTNKRLKKNDKIKTDTINLPTPTTTCQSEDDLTEITLPGIDVLPPKSREKDENLEENAFQGIDVLPQKSLDSYQSCLKLVKPLKDYINHIGNDQASLRLREIEKVIKYVIKNEKRTRKSCQ